MSSLQGHRKEGWGWRTRPGRESRNWQGVSGEQWGAQDTSKIPLPPDFLQDSWTLMDESAKTAQRDFIILFRLLLISFPLRPGAHVVNKREEEMSNGYFCHVYKDRWRETNKLKKTEKQKNSLSNSRYSEETRKKSLWDLRVSCLPWLKLSTEVWITCTFVICPQTLDVVWYCHWSAVRQCPVSGDTLS